MKRKRIISAILTVVLILGTIYIPNLCISSSAANVSLADLKAKFPEGKFWNHYVSTSTDAYDYLKAQGISTKFDDSVTSTACAYHSGSRSYSAYVGCYDCNRFNGATQCCGFAQKIAYVAYGSYCTAWSRGSLSSLKPGDVIHYYGNGTSSEWGHWVMVIGVNGSAITVGECNWGGHCKINWSRVIYTGNLSSTTVYSAPWELPTGSTPAVSLTEDTRYPVPFKCRTISAEKVRCYNDAEKTSSPGYIYPEDDCVINKIYTNGLVQCDCPWNDGSTKTVYADKSDFIDSSMAPASMSAPQYAVTYLESSGSTSIGWIDPGDSITKVAVSGSYTQVIYPASVGKRCAWVSSSALNTVSALSWPQFICRTVSAEKVRCYSDIGYTETPGFIYPEDDCTITAVYENGKVQCLCPWNDGTTKTVYVDKSEFIPSSTSPRQMTAPKYAETYLRTNSMGTKWGWVDPGDTIYKLGESGNATQILYPNANGVLRCAWVYTSDLTESYTVSFNANGGSGAPGNQIKTYGTSLTLSSTVPTRSGYTFLGWSTNSGASSAQYGAGGVYTTDAGATLYAIWKANQYNVSFNANGGNGAPSPQTKTHNVSLTLSTSKPTRSGYTFLGWSTASDSSDAVYSAGGTYTANASTVLYAVWKENKYTVSFNANGGTNTPSSQTKTYGQTLKLSSAVPTKAGYSFLGWSSSDKSQTVEYKAGDFYYYDSSVTLYAVWEENKPSVLPGDVNGDGAVNNKDLTRLMKYLSGENVYVIEEALDINNDNTVNNKDLTRLMKYLSGEDVAIS